MTSLRYYLKIKHMKINPKLFIGPVSKNVVDASIDEANYTQKYLCLIPSRRQIDFDSGYVNNWRTKDFVEYVTSRSEKILIQRDHGGPSQGELDDDGLESIIKDAKNNFFLIHIDPWKKFQNLEDAIDSTIFLIKKSCEINADLFFEVGTEEAIRKYSINEFDFFLKTLKIKLGEIFKRIKYASIQSGTGLEINQNIGEYNKKKSLKFIEICNKYNILSKEHNGDYLETFDIKQRFSSGLHAINIAPEFGYLETKCLLEDINRRSDKNSLKALFEICYESGKWKKWIPPHKVEDIFHNNKQIFIETCCHYSFSNPDVISIKQKNPNIDNIIRARLRKRIRELLCTIR